MDHEKKRNEINSLIAACADAIRRRGAHARVIFRVPGKWGKQITIRLFPGGPVGTIISATHDRKKVLVPLAAAETQTILEGIRNDDFTSRN